MQQPDLQSALLETPQELLASLAHIAPEWAVRTKYGVLREVLNVAADQRLSNVTVKLSGLYAKIDFLLKRYGRLEKDRSLHFGLNDARHHLMQLETLTDAQLQRMWPTDLRAVASFVALIYNAPIPDELRRQFPAPSEAPRPRGRGEKGGVVPFFRCIVDRWDDRTFHATREDNGEEVVVDFAHPMPYVKGDWTYVHDLLREGVAVNVVRPHLSDDGRTARPELLIVDPDYLINVTSVAHCFDACGTSPLADVLGRLAPFEVSIPQLLGNFAGQLLDEVAYGKEVPYAESIRSFFRTNALSFATCDDIAASPEKARGFHLDAQQQKRHIEALLSAKNENRTWDFQAENVILEPSFISDMLGLQGRMDFLDLNYTSVIEQKSGKCQWVPGARPDEFAGGQTPHVVQTLLYRALLHYVYDQPNEHIQAQLLYSRYADGVDYVMSRPELLFEALRMRNHLAWLEGRMADEGIDFLRTLTPEQVFPDAGGTLWVRYKRPQLEALLAPIHQASLLEQAYYFRFLRFVANEHALSRIGNRTKENAGFAATWNASTDDKRAAGNIYERLSLTPVGDDDAVSDVVLHFPAGGDTPDADSSNFRVGDIVFVYAYAQGTRPDATRAVLFRGTLVAQGAESVTVHLRNAQTSPSVFRFYGRKGMLWAMEHDFMEASYTSLYRGLHAFLSAPQRRRDLLLGQRQPEVDTGITLKGTYGGGEFDDLVLRARQARDLFLLIGPPGTGKTSYGLKNILQEELLEEGTNVLLLSYTNRAVDEICSKLLEEHIDFLRLGSESGCDERYRPHLLSERVKTASTLADVRRIITTPRVVCGTTTALNSSSALFKLRRFDLTIVDEASQILEPHIIGLLSAHRADGTCCIGRFVLIGDEKQLPAVVQQGSDESMVEEAVLKDIGLTDCRLSLFERLLHLYGYDHTTGRPRPEVCHLLTHQGRMHRDIAEFPSVSFYGNRLDVVPLPHQEEPTPSTAPAAADALERLLLTRRVAFIDCLPNDNPDEPDKVNEAEARLVAAIVRRVYDGAPDDFDAARTVGVIVPYRNQISTIRCCLPEHLRGITIDTVERYQGSQRDVIVYSFTAKKKYQLQFLTSNEYVDPLDNNAVIDRKLNVAMTRARKRLVLTGNARLLRADYTFGRLIAYAQRHGAFYAAEGLNDNSGQ